MNKTGLFFGSFNPIHVGHMVLANYMLEFTRLDEVWFVVSPQNPLKEKQTLLAQNHRLAMVRLAVEDHPKLKASNIEFKLPQPSYTINTLAYLKEKYPKKDFSLIMGMDNLQTFDKWKNHEQILKNHVLFIYPRPGFNAGKFANHTNVRITEAPVMEISSSFIRNAIKENKNVSCFMPDKVSSYIMEMNFYKSK
ncbi:MAG TPA: nicotinate (nicotinamide) nucleotide adenylyltransferase [Bacteroidia bacterium]|nr:nicotinate (nicotinamide) nucleotide adenylyltransferase [Bacteroidia bacterium]